MFAFIVLDYCSYVFVLFSCTQISSLITLIRSKDNKNLILWGGEGKEIKGSLFKKKKELNILVSRMLKNMRYIQFWEYILFRVFF